jgi:hypothetical protein
MSASSFPLPWQPKTTTILLATTSALKRNAVAAWLAEHGAAETTTRIETFEPHDTKCPQPASEQSANQCIALRLRDRTRQNDQVILAIENFVEPDGHGGWRDRALVYASYSDAQGGQHTATSLSMSIAIPPQYSPERAPDIAHPLGFQQTVGERIHSERPEVPNNDWFKGVSEKNASRHEQIIDALRRLK